MSCLECERRPYCKKICKEVEALLPKKTTGRNKKELLFDIYYLELLAEQRAFKLRYGEKRKKEDD